MKTLSLIIGALAIGYLGICAWLYLRQSALVFFPSKALEATPVDYSMYFVDVRIESTDGAKLFGWHIYADSTIAGGKARGTILFCHGNGGNISHRLELISLWRSLGFDVFCFDYQGYGQSEGAPSERATYDDVRAVWDYLVAKRHIAPENMLVLGRSLGAAVASHLVAELSRSNQPTPAGLILEAPFTSIPERGAQLYPYLPVRWLSRIKYDNRASLADIHLPTLFLHGVEDAIVPITMGEEVFTSANEPKRFVKLAGGHEDTYLVSREQYSAALVAFASETLASN